MEHITINVSNDLSIYKSYSIVSCDKDNLYNLKDNEIVMERSKRMSEAV